MKTLSEVLKSSMKYIICDCAKQDWGKTKTLINVAKILRDDKKYTNGNIFGVGEKNMSGKYDDYLCYFTYGDVSIAVLTYGDRDDNDTIEDNCLKKIETDKINILVCASSWKNGNIYKEITKLAKTEGCNLILCNNLHTDDDKSLNGMLYENSAVAIVATIDELVEKCK